MKWLQRIGEWRRVVKAEGAKGNVLRMVRGLFDIGVTREQWTHRMHVCQRCPIYDRRLKRCRHHVVDPLTGEHKGQLGCGCYTPFKALTKTPYIDPASGVKGCWGRVATRGRYGWR